METLEGGVDYKSPLFAVDCWRKADFLVGLAEIEAELEDRTRHEARKQESRGHVLSYKKLFVGPTFGSIA